MLGIHYKSKKIFLSFLILLLIGIILNSPSVRKLEPIDGNGLISFANASPSDYPNTTIHYGDLIVQQNETVVIRNAKYIVEGNIQIYGNLTVENSELLVKYDSSQYRCLRCYSSGNLTAVNSTIGYEGEPEWYISDWHPKGSVFLRNVKSPEINWHIQISCRVFTFENSFANEIFIFSEVFLNNSVVVENGRFTNASGLELPGKVSFIGDNVVRVHYCIGIWCHEYSNLAIRDTPAFYFENTSNFFVSGSKVEAKIQIFMYDYSSAYVDNSTVQGIYCYDNSMMNATNTTIDYLNVYYNSKVYLKNSTVQGIYCYDNSMMNATNTTIDYLNVYYNSKVYLKNSTVGNVYCYEWSRFNATNTAINSLIIGHNCWVYVENSTIRGFDQHVCVSSDGLLIIKGETIVSAINAYFPNVVLENTVIEEFFKTCVDCYSNSTLKLVNVNGTWESRRPWHIFLLDGFRLAEINNSQIDLVRVESYSGGTLKIYNSTISSIDSWNVNVNSTIFLKKVYVYRVLFHGSCNLTANNSTILTLKLYDNFSATLSNHTIVKNFVSCFNIYDNNYIVVNGSQIVSTKTSNPQVFCDETSKIEQQGIEIYLYDNARGEIINANINGIHCYGSSALNMMNSTLNYMSIGENSTATLINSKVTDIYCYDQSKADITSSDIGYINLYGNSFLSADNCTLTSVYAYSGSSAYFAYSEVNYFYTDYDVNVTLVDTFVSSSSFSDPSTIEMIDTQNPIILSISYSPSSPHEGEEITITVQIKEMSIDQVFLLYSLDNISWTQVFMVKVSSDSFSATIGPFPANSTLFYKIVAKDQGGRETESPVYTIFIKGLGTAPEGPEEGGGNAGVSPSGVQPFGGLFSIFLSAILLLAFLLLSSVLYAAVKSRTGVVGERISKPKLIREEKTPIQRIRSLIFGGDYEGAYDVIKSVYTIDNVDAVLKEVSPDIRVKFSSWLLSRLLEDGFYDQAVNVASMMKDLGRLRAIYLGVAMKKLAEGDKREAVELLEKAIEVSVKMRDLASVKALRETLRKTY